MSLQLISPQAAIQYVQQNTNIFAKNANLVAKPITTEKHSVEGYVNLIHLIRDVDSGQSVAFKQMLPYVRAAKEAGKHIPLPVERLRVEIAAFKVWGAFQPQLIPQIYWQDEQNSILIMEDLSRMKLLRFGLMKMKRFPIFPVEIGTFLGKNAVFTSDLYLDPIAKKQLVQALANPEFRSLFEAFIFIDTFFGEKPVNPKVKGELTELLADKSVLLQALKLKDVYATQAQALIHSDLHTSNICVNSHEIKIFDAESAFFGPVAFDIGRLLGNFVLNYASWEAITEVSPEAKQDYRQYLLQTIEQIYHQFEATFVATWNQYAKPEYRRVEAYQKEYLGSILRDAVGIAGCACLARLYDEVECPELQGIKDLDQKALAQKLLLKLVRNLLVDRHQVQSVEDFTRLIVETRTTYVIEQAVWKTIVRLKG